MFFFTSFRAEPLRSRSKLLGGSSSATLEMTLPAPLRGSCPEVTEGYACSLTFFVIPTVAEAHEMLVT
jgi:hypothetical protein